MGNNGFEDTDSVRGRALGETSVPSGSGGDELTLRAALAVLWRRKWIIILTMVVATSAAYFYSARQAKQYAAAASLIYEKNVDVANPLSEGYVDTYALDREMAAIADIIASPDMQERASVILEEDGVDDSAGYAVSSSAQTSDSSGGGAGGSNVVLISAVSEDPKLASAAANAYGEAFVAWRKQRQQTQIQKAADAVEAQLGEYPQAAQATGDYLMLKQRLQDLVISKATATGNYRMLVPATAPTQPFAPDPLRTALLGLAVGLFGGIGLAFLLEQFDLRLRTPDEIAAELRVPILGRIPRISRKDLAQNTLVTLAHPDGSAAEAFRMVRTNLDFLNVDADISSLVVSSCVQGEGKSVACANLAVSMALAGKKVIVVDGDLRRPRQHQYFGLSNEVGLSTVATGQTNLAQSLQAVEVAGASPGEPAADFAGWARGADARQHLYVLTSGPLPPNPGEIVSAKRFASTIERLRRESDLVIVDSPAMLPVGDASAIASSVDGLVFLVDMHLVKRPQLAQAAAQLRRLPCRLLGTVVRGDESASGRSGYYAADYTYSSASGNGGQKKAKKIAARRSPTAAE